MIKTKDIKYSVPGKDIIKNIDLNIQRGKFYGILGPNGSGKTTLLDILAGIIEGHSGDVIIADKNITGYSKKELAKVMALVPQNFDTAFPFSVEEVLEMGRYPHKKKFSFGRKDDQKIIDEVTKELELENMLEKKVTDLSGGERQRVVFGKALIQDTPLLFLDESTSNLDPYYAHSLLTKVRSRVDDRGLTVVSVFHDFNLASLYCDEVIFLKDGKVVKSGKTEETLSPETIKYVFNINSKLMDDGEKKFVIPYM